MKFLRNLLKGASLTTALFIFQACYGTPNWQHETDVEFKVVSDADGTPIGDVEIFTRISESEYLGWNLCGYTAEDGTASVLAGVANGQVPQFRFDASASGYVVKDTVITNLEGRTIEIRMQKAK